MYICPPPPLQCPSKTFGGFDSTKDLPDDVITFARGHPAMYNPVHPIGGRPIMVRTDVDYQFSQLVVDRVEAEDGQYDVMFIGTGQCPPVRLTFHQKKKKKRKG